MEEWRGGPSGRWGANQDVPQGMARGVAARGGATPPEEPPRRATDSKQQKQPAAFPPKKKLVANRATILFPSWMEEKMNYDVSAFPDTNGRWHWHILGSLPPLPQGASAVGVYATCRYSGCPGFADMDAAVEDAQALIRRMPLHL